MSSGERCRPLLSDPEAPNSLSFRSSPSETSQETFPRLSWPRINHSHMKAAGIIAYLLSGVVTMYFLGSSFLGGVVTNPIVDSFYFCIVTMTTVGYGDLAPDSVPSKIFVCFYVFVGIIVADMVVSRYMENLLASHNDRILAFMALNGDDGLNQTVQSKSKNTLTMVKSSRFFRDGTVAYGEAELETAWHRVKIAAFYLFLCVLSGTLVLHFWEGLSILDAIYCACVTVTTVGYGDKSFSTKPGRCFAIVWILASTFFLAQLFGRLADARATDQQAALAKEVLLREVTEADLRTFDMDNDGKVSPHEFVIQKLIELKKVDQKDVDVLFERFKMCDTDSSGHLDIDDLNVKHKK